jgi:hypothetical protein
MRGAVDSSGTAAPTAAGSRADRDVTSVQAERE